MKRRIIRYKYFSIENDEQKEHLLDVIEKQRLFLGSGNDYNDPFDLLIKTKDSTRKISTLKIACLTNSFRKKLMWSHYSNSHKGVCLTIEIPRKFVLPVCYTGERISEDTDLAPIIERALKKYPPKDLIDELRSAGIEKQRACIKDQKWSYEKECRVVVNDDDLSDSSIIKDGGKYYIRIKVKNIYLGVNFDEKSNSDIIAACKEQKISIRKMKLSQSSYGLTVDLFYSPPKEKVKELK